MPYWLADWLTGWLTGLLTAWQVRRVMALLNQRVGRVSLRGRRIKARQVVSLRHHPGRGLVANQGFLSQLPLRWSGIPLPRDDRDE